MPHRLFARDRGKFTFYEQVKWSTATEFRRDAFIATVKEGNRRLTLDFSNVVKAYPNGVVPIIIEVQRLVASGTKVNVVPPTDAHTLAFFRNFGWLHYLDSSRWHDRTVIDTNPYSLRKFRTPEELNETINSAAATCFQDLIFAKGAHDAFIWSLNEVADNVLVHSQGEYGWLQVVTYTHNHSLSLVVSDSGVGILNTLSAAYDVHSDEDAIQLAITKGVTRDAQIGQGNGLAGTYSIAQHSLGYLAITSNRGRLTMIDGKVKTSRHFPPFEGTFIDMTLSTSTEVDLPRAIGGTPMSFTDMKYVEEGGEIKVDLRQYASNFGNRPTGKMLRTLVANLIEANQGQVVKVDMRNVGIISSSFADELFGKLYISLGPLNFGQTIKLINLNPTCADLIDIAIKQRIAQTMAAPNPAVRRQLPSRRRRPHG